MGTFDIVGGIELTLSAAILMAVVGVVIGRSVGMRLRIVGGLGVWFVIVVVLGGSGVLHRDHGMGSAGLGVAVALPIAVMWIGMRRVGAVRAGVERAAIGVLVGVHVVRMLGINFIILQAKGRLPVPFAPVAGWGDIIAGLEAVPTAWMVYRQAAGWRRMLLVWNVFGMADLAAAIGLGVLSSPGPLRVIMAESGTGIMSTLPWLLIPGFIVPLLAAIHLMIFYRLSGVVQARTVSGGVGEAYVA
jgi:hypothetical protein